MNKILLNHGWEFSKLSDGDILNPYIPETLSEKDYCKVTLPHTWYTDENQYRGLTVYRKILMVSKDWEKVFLEFEGADQYCKVFVNDILIGEHQGAYSCFRVELPDCVMSEEEVCLEVYVSNAENQKISPIFGDFTIFGGLYRNVNLLITGKEHFDYLYYGTNGVIARASLEGENGLLEIDSHVIAPDGAIICYDVFDEDGTIAAQASGPVNESVRFQVPHPYLWNGKGKGILYTLRASLCVNGKTVDEVCEKIGFRSIKMDGQTGFYLNGQKEKIRGVSMHQDFAEVFSAMTAKHKEVNFKLIHEIGANAIRLSHYQHPQYNYDRCDQEGYIVWAEIPMLKMTEDRDLFENAKQQLTELILQNIHHPSICFWGIQNEIGMFKDAPYMHDMCRELYSHARELDHTRLITGANLYTVKYESELNKITDMVGYNIYFGWYYGEMNDYDSFLDQFHAACPQTPIGVSEYGVDTNPSLHSEQPTVRDYSEEYQALYSETVYRIFDSKEYLWGSFVWNMFDFSSFRRNEGGMKYINQKGLVTYDRKIKKDAFYYYKAMWSEESFIHICSKRFSKRAEDLIDIKVYTNQDEVALFGNDGKDFICSAHNNGNGTVIFQNIALLPGKNCFVVKRVKAEEGTDYIEDCVTFERVDEKEMSYQLPDSGAGKAVRNWFLKEDDIVREGYFSLKDSAYDITQNQDAMKVFSRFAPATAEKILKDEGIPLGLSLMSIVDRDKDNNPDFKMEDLNHALNQIKKY
ncbi:glycoside hydrolase family 2 TIM barrel-domain containing protein [Clostridium sp. E02]|uniref:glycoside hydrolase family 2 protein n=1 Tax=Clostridium sp. E02 TaxID=2487134 RepID=UPI000F53AFF8|nr:glycoside hydrolase family 2 TIM barrel-domain containing protein [Clostridium sp. E02]